MAKAFETYFSKATCVSDSGIEDESSVVIRDLNVQRLCELSWNQSAVAFFGFVISDGAPKNTTLVM